MRIRVRIRVLAAVALAAFVLGPVLLADDGDGAGDGDATESKVLAIGATAPDFTATDTDGKAFQMSKLAVTRAQAEEAVRAVAKEYGATGEIDLGTKIDDLSGVKDDEGELDTMLKRALVAQAGAFYGLQASEESAAAFGTLEDVVKWIEGSNDAPVILMCWSPRCPTSRKLNDAINEKISASGARLFAIACNYRDTAEHYAKFREMVDFYARIIPDTEQAITDVLGGERTPHFMVFDAKRILRFRGSLDNDPMDVMDEDEKENWLLDALAAIKAGKDVPKTETPGPG